MIPIGILTEEPERAGMETSRLNWVSVSFSSSRIRGARGEYRAQTAKQAAKDKVAKANTVVLPWGTTPVCLSDMVFVLLDSTSIRFFPLK
jgi:hypothetical protein